LSGTDTAQNRVCILDKPPKLMYRPPNRDKYLQVAEALDEIFNRLEAIEKKLNTMETK